MEINSPEFYALVFAVTMTLLWLFMGQREKGPASTHIVQLGTEPDDNPDGSDDTVSLESVDHGRVRVMRRGFSIGSDETVNLVITVRGQECSIVEKKGVKRRGSVGEPAIGQAVFKGLRPGLKYRVRYESQLTSTWATFTFDTTSPAALTVPLKY